MISTVCAAMLLASTVYATPRNTYKNYSFDVQIVNNGFYYGPPPGHKLTYFITNTSGEHPYGPLSATLEPTQQMNTIVFQRMDGKNLTVTLKVIDPDAQGHVVWYGQITYDISTDKISDLVYNEDTQNYYIKPDITQPETGYTPNFQLDIQK